MKSFSYKVLRKLLEKYENSKVSKGTNKRNITIKIDEKDKLFEKYNSLKNIKFKPDYDFQLKQIEEKGFVNLEYEFSMLNAIVLNIDKVNEIYDYLNIINPKTKYGSVKDYLDQLFFDSFLDDFVEDLKQSIKSGVYHSSYYSDLSNLQTLFKILVELLDLDDQVMERDFSVRVLNDSKLFNQYKKKVIRVLKNYDTLCPKDESDDYILEYYNITKNSTYALIRNGLTFKINNQIIDLDALGYEYYLTDKMIKDLDIIYCSRNKLITVENLTSFHMLKEDAIIVYLGGFHNHTKQSLLIKIYEKFQELEYYHFGDIDVGGFLIYQNLVEKTSIPFKPYRMDVKELIENKDHLKPLTDNDIKRLLSLEESSLLKIFNNEISYMLSNNVKLEQEILD